MIREIQESEYEEVYKFAKIDVARNYFILLGLKNKTAVYDNIYGEYNEAKLQAILLKRKSGTLQFFAPGEFDAEAFSIIISKLNYTSMIGPGSYCNIFLDKDLFSSKTNGAYIAKLDRELMHNPSKEQQKTKDLLVKDLDKIIKLYKTVFKSFSSKEIMKGKLESKRGRGLYIEENGEIISVSQTDFETEDSAVIVGVATKPEYRCKGLATLTLKELSNLLLEEGKDLYLQYENLEAGKIYEKLGFEIIDQVIHLKK